MPGIISQQRITRFIQSRFNPIRSLTPEWLAQMIDSFDAGFLREFALMADAIERRDDILASVAPKRKKAIGRHGYEIITTEKSAKAEAHKATLQHFYGHVTAINAINENERGGFKLLVRQMADCIGKKYAVHEIVWKPSPDGLTADFRFAPLWFFENRNGRLRYLPQEGMTDGLELDPDNWLVSIGDGLMLPCAIAYMFKNLPLKDWLIYCERFGMPVPIGTTNAPKDSPEWAAMLAAVEAIMSGVAGVKNAGEDIALLETKGHGELPHPKLVERMDRTMSAMWRGSDLSTMSRGGSSGSSSGASVQGEESEILELDDTEMISETLNIQVTRAVIRWEHGDNEPLAFIKVLTARKQDVQQDILVDQFLLNAGFPLDLQSVGERYGRAIPEGKADLLKPAAPLKDVANPDDSLKGVDNTRMANAREQLDSAGHVAAKALQAFGKARAATLTPVADRIKLLLATQSDELFAAGLRQLRTDLPGLLRNVNADPATVPILADTQSASFFNGIDDAEMAKGAA